MSGEYLTIYQAGRKGADLTQEAAAECLEVSVESLKAYELGLRVPPNAVVARMTEAYGADWLALMHLRNISVSLGVLPESMKIQSLQMAVMRCTNRMREFIENHRDQALLWIAEDGAVDAGEQDEFDSLIEKMMEIVGAMYQVRFAIHEKA